VAAKRVVFQWAASSFFGWGVYGLNLALFGKSDGVTVASAAPLRLDRVVVDSLRRWCMSDFFRVSQQLNLDLAPLRGTITAPDCTVLHALGNQLDLAASAVNNIRLIGKKTIGVAFFEETLSAPQVLERANAYEMIIAGSTWNGAMLRAAGLSAVKVVLQGVDPTLFHPAPRAGLFRDRFVVFSGGKLEYRKGQDLVLRAFRAFHQRHPEALLVTAWHSPWSVDMARSLAGRPGLAPVPTDSKGAVDIRGWAQANGVPAEAVIDVGEVPNALMPPILREADAAIFASRCEGGTNLVAMETMACGVPCVISANTGHGDLIGSDNCYALGRQSPIAAAHTRDWGESDVEEIVEALEAIYWDRAEAARRAAVAAEAMAGLNWAAQIAKVMVAIEP
jgi:glycosyltransferase involved in cell wall biosynthesis